jgi:hypothetical protein
MSPSWVEITQAITSMGSLGVAVCGFAVVIYQIRQIQKALHSDTHSKLYSEDFDWAKLIIQYPELRPYFYENQEIREDTPDSARARTLAELLCAHFEHAVLQMENLPSHIKPRWEDYMRGICATSPAIREHLKAHSDWYSERLHQLLGTNKVDSAQPCE